MRKYRWVPKALTELSVSLTVCVYSSLAHLPLQLISVGNKDFPRMAQSVMIPRGKNMRRNFSHPIPINDDPINEEMEAFLIVVETSEQSAINPAAPIINYKRNGLATCIINDDDGQFSTSMCTAQSNQKRQHFIYTRIKAL